MSEPVDPNAQPVAGHADDAGYRPPPPFAPRYGTAAQPLPVPYFPPAGYAAAQPVATMSRRSHRGRGPDVVDDGRRHGIWLYTGIAVMAAAAVIVAIVVATSGDAASDPTRLGLPTSFDGYTKIDSQSSQQVESSIRNLGAGDPETASIFDAASVGVYSRNTGDLPGLVALTLPTSKITGGARLSSDELAAQLVRGALTPGRTTDLPPGPRGGSVKCGTTSAQATTVSVCAWADRRAVGLLLAIRPYVAPNRLAQIENDFRDKVE